MLLLRSSQMLQTLERALRKDIPESIKVYGTIFHMNQGNPFKLEVLVDRWPDFKTVIVRPQVQDMTDDFDPYTNTYQVYSKDLQNCQEALKSSDVINWKQHLQIQGLQSGLNEVISNVAVEKSVQVKMTNRNLYLISETMNRYAPSQQNVDQSLAKTEKPKKDINTEIFKMSSLDIEHAALVNSLWSFGGNEKSLKFIQRCIRHFPSYCLLGPQGTPVSWDLMDQTGELRMAGTLPEYRGLGLISHIIYHQIQALDKLGYPMYSHIDKDNQPMQRMSQTMKQRCAPCHWQQWDCKPDGGSAPKESQSQGEAGSKAAGSS
ncbi:glycine N-acyltransferase [Sarcophilus harrisii]|uniref:Glycine N-acyltransferase-like protein n=1 Tax=Sarcophilus harrisii TaxID=9305 RepID=A0A7N4NYH0_SARHA|nr:glycine N-acyltransferase [Sarcophilus harrisii]XP_023362209.1 glycine N-acyltransferase [Sarcophilus harrisii]XP_031797709.1 glycine N-acyltransferase [Sarcophilus harrisii]XP_031797711.1 glycine N-acyltransferase [Sarcophilus harrisii]